jgi:hypothetical protein
MSPFDERFAERAREVFDAYEEPVDEAELNRLQVALNHRPSAAPMYRQDREPTAQMAAPRVRWVGIIALGALILAGGVWQIVARIDVPGLPEAAQPLVAEGPTIGLERAPSAREQDERQPGTDGLVDEARPITHVPVTRTELSAIEGDADASADTPYIPSRLPELAYRSREPAPLDLIHQPDRSAHAVAGAGVMSPPAHFGPEDRRLVREPQQPFAGGGAFEGMRLVVATGAVIARGQIAEGGMVSAGLVHNGGVSRGVRISGGAIVAYNRLSIGTGGDVMARASSSLENEAIVNVTTHSTLSLLAIEIPLDVVLDLMTSPRGRVSAAVGLTSVFYLTQAFEDEGVTFAYTTGSAPVLTSQSYTAQESVGLLDRIDLGRQLNLSLGYTPRLSAFPVDVEGYVRLPLGGLTSRDLTLTTAGVRLRFGLP